MAIFNLLIALYRTARKRNGFFTPADGKTHPVFHADGKITNKKNKNSLLSKTVGGEANFQIIRFCKSRISELSSKSEV